LIQQFLGPMRIIYAAGTGFGKPDALLPGTELAGLDPADGIANQAGRDHAVAAHGGVLADIGRRQQLGSAVNAQGHVNRVVKGDVVYKAYKLTSRNMDV
jgi:hypothetical protein